jgi:MYXO-CTERM domain-containing protein
MGIISLISWIATMGKFLAKRRNHIPNHPKEPARMPQSALAVCVGAPYVCEIDELGDSWDPDRCNGWPPSEEETAGPDAPTTGGGTTSESTSGTTATTSDGGATTSPADDGLVEHGCACSGAGASSEVWLASLALAGLRRRRQRG